jgi:hypothetical protein
MSSNLDSYIPGFDEAAIRANLADFTKQDLIEEPVLG